jgi:hypothetical protein
MSASRHRRKRALRVRRPRVRRCAICGSKNNLQEHHLGGFRHVPYFTIPLCQPHHERVSILIAQAGINIMRCSSDKSERARRARQAAYVFLWFLDEAIPQ